MEQPWLIQRAKFRNVKNENSETVDQIIQFDYMGSAEFEWGALPKSLKRICKNIDEFIITESSIKNYEQKFLFLLHNKNDSPVEYEKYLLEDIAGKLRLKEWTNLHTHITGVMFNDKPIPDHVKELNIWWDLDNDIWFTFGKEQMLRIKNAIQNVKKKKMEDGDVEWY